MATSPSWQAPIKRHTMKLAVWLYRRSGGKIGGTFKGAPVMLLTTTGRKTGRIWTTPVLYGRDGDQLVVIASAAGNDRHPAWWLNLRDNKHGTVRLGTDTFDVIPHEVEGEERDRLWSKMAELYPPYNSYATKTSRKIPVVVLNRA